MVRGELSTDINATLGGLKEVIEKDKMKLTLNLEEIYFQLNQKLERKDFLLLMGQMNTGGSLDPDLSNDPKPNPNPNPN